MWCGFLSPIIIISLLFYFASIGGFGEMPDIEVLENPKTNLASEIFSSDYKTLGKFYFNDNRTPVKFEDLPTHLINALIATEDIRFFSHSGIDFKSTLRAIIKLGSDGGGSTITQQLAKQLFTGEGSKNIFERISQKFKESGFSIEIEILAKFLKFNRSVIEVPIKYEGRSYKEGKKIKTIDGFNYLLSTLKYRLIN